MTSLQISLRFSTFIGACLLMFSALADTYTITTNAPTGVGSLFEAIGLANANPGHDTIKLELDSAIVLTAPLPAITDDLDIVGVPLTGDFVIIDGDDAYRPLFLAAGSLSIRKLLIRKALHTGGDGGAGSGGGGAGMGGALFIESGAIALVRSCVFDMNLANGGNGGPANVFQGGGGGGGFDGGGGDGSTTVGSDGAGIGNGIGGADAGGSGSGGGGGGGGDLLGIGGDGIPENTGFVSQNATDGAGGGGGGSGAVNGGTGGFAGGGAGAGGAGLGTGGNGGFGGGGGGSSFNPVTATGGAGGNFGGDGGKGDLASRGGAGGGAGLGGAIFVRDGGTLDIMDSIFTRNEAHRGVASPPAGLFSTFGTDGQGKGGAIFVMTGATALRRPGVIFGDPETDPDLRDPSLDNFASDADVTQTDNVHVWATFTLAPALFLLDTLTSDATIPAWDVWQIDVEASGGAEPYTYHWQFRAPGGDFVNMADAAGHLSGTDTATLEFACVLLDDEGEYRCIVTEDDLTEHFSQVVNLTVDGEGRGGPDVYVDFTNANLHVGTQADPLNSLEDAQIMVTEGGTIHIAPGFSGETFTLDKSATYIADGGGSATIGVQ